MIKRILLFIIMISSVTAVPLYMDQQGILRDNSNNLLTGMYIFNVTFNRVSDHTQMYTEERLIGVNQGVWNYVIGEGLTIDPSVFENDLYMNLTIGVDEVGRINLTTVPYSFYSYLANNSNYLSGQSAAYYLQTDNEIRNAINNSGRYNITINASNIINAQWYDSLADLQTAVTNDFHNLGGTDDDTPDSDAEVPDDITIASTTSKDVEVRDGSLNACDGDSCTKVGADGTIYSEGNAEFDGDIYVDGGDIYTNSGNLALSPAGYVHMQSAAGQNQYFDAGGTFYFRDQDSSDANRLLIDSSNGKITKYAWNQDYVSYTQGGSLLYYPYGLTSYEMWSPFAQNIWEDIFAFNNIDTPDVARYNSGTTTWDTETSDAYVKGPFDQRTSTYTALDCDGTYTKIKYDWYAVNLGYSSIDWINIHFPYVATAPTRRVTYQTSADGITYTTRHNSTISVTVGSFMHSKAYSGGDIYHRLQISCESGTENILIGKIQGLTIRIDKASYEYKFPYQWTSDKDMTFLGSAVFNEYSEDEDFRVESDGNANMLMVDASANSVCVGAATCSGALGVTGTTYTTDLEASDGIVQACDSGSCPAPSLAGDGWLYAELGVESKGNMIAPNVLVNSTAVCLKDGTNCPSTSGNTTQEMIDAVNSSTGYFSNMKNAWANLQGIPAGFADGTDADTWNTTTQIRNAINNSGPYNFSDGINIPKGVKLWLGTGCIYQNATDNMITWRGNCT